MGNSSRKWRRAPWAEPLDHEITVWLFNASFWKNVTVNVVSAAIIAMAAAFILAMAIYEQAGYTQIKYTIMKKYALVMYFFGLAVVFYFIYKALYKRRSEWRYVFQVPIFIFILLGAIALIDVWILQMTNLINTVEIVDNGKRTPQSSLIPGLLYDRYGNPEYMGQVPYRSTTAGALTGQQTSQDG